MDTQVETVDAKERQLDADREELEGERKKLSQQRERFYAEKGELEQRATSATETELDEKEKDIETRSRLSRRRRSRCLTARRNSVAGAGTPGKRGGAPRTRSADHGKTRMSPLRDPARFHKRNGSARKSERF